MAYRYIRMKDFVVSSDVAYKPEFGNGYIRIWSGDTNVDEITDSPYLTAHLFQLQMRQIADTMWIVHPLYYPRKLTRTAATPTFSLDIIPFNNGPFLIRNDLIGYSSTPATMQFLPTGYTVATLTADIAAGSSDDVKVGAVGTLTCSNDFFDAGHGPVDGTGTGALFKLVSKRTKMVSQCTKSKHRYGGPAISPFYAADPDADPPQDEIAAVGTPYEICSPIDIKGVFNYVSGGTWDGVLELQRNENEASDGSGLIWETVKVTNSDNNANIQLSKEEDKNNVQYRVMLTEYRKQTDKFVSASLTSDNGNVDGIVRITAVTNPTTATCVVVAKLDWSNGVLATTKWAEGAWSYYRGFPASVTFFEDRCIYAGSKAIPILTET